MSLRVADSHTGNHHEDRFTPLETIQMLLSIIWEKIPFELEGEAFKLERRSSIVPAKYPQLLLEQNKWDSKSYKDKIPPNIEENSMFQRLGRYPTSVCIFRDPILFLAGLKPSWEYGQQRPTILVGRKEMAFRNFIYAKNEEDLSFLPKEPSLGFGTGPPSVLVNTEPPNVDAEPTLNLAKVTTDFGGSPKPEVFVVHPRSVANLIKDMRYKTSGGSSRPPLKIKLTPGSLSSRATRAKTSSLKDDPPFLTVSDDDEGLLDVFELKDAKCLSPQNFCYYSSSFEESFGQCHLDVELLDLHDRCYARKGRELERRSVRRMMLGEAKWTGYQVSFGFGVGRLPLLEREAELEVVKVSLRKERCAAFEKVADMKEPFDLPKVKAYRPSYKKEHTQSGNELATATFPWLSEFVVDPSAPIEVLPSKKPLTL
ncbi:hypothetical protein Tco_0737496 [Tanacetum coccineum]